MLVVSSKEFREKQALYMDKADEGEQIVVHRGKNKAYSLSAISEQDIYFSPKMMEQLDKSIQQATEGKVTRIRTKEELSTFLDSL